MMYDRIVCATQETEFPTYLPEDESLDDIFFPWDQDDIVWGSNEDQGILDGEWMDDHFGRASKLRY